MGLCFRAHVFLYSYFEEQTQDSRGLFCCLFICKNLMQIHLAFWLIIQKFDQIVSIVMFLSVVLENPSQEKTFSGPPQMEEYSGGQSL